MIALRSENTSQLFPPFLNMLEAQQGISFGRKLEAGEFLLEALHRGLNVQFSRALKGV